MPYMRGLAWRVFALIYAWTIGALIGVVILLSATLYSVVDIVNAAAGNSTFWKEFTLMTALMDALSWQADLHRYAFLGTGPGFKPVPDVSF